MEAELLQRIEKLEIKNKEIINENELKCMVFNDSLLKSKQEIEDLNIKISKLDKELKQKYVVSLTCGEMAKESVKGDELLRKAKELLFENSKISQNQEMQIKALNVQLISIKDVLSYTKEMLEIRNCEIEQMQLQLDSVELRFKTEKDLMEKKIEISQKLYNHLKSEHELQSDLFKELKQGYKTRVEMVTAELNKLKANQNVQLSNRSK